MNEEPQIAYHHSFRQLCIIHCCCILSSSCTSSPKIDKHPKLHQLQKHANANLSLAIISILNNWAVLFLFKIVIMKLVIFHMDIGPYIIRCNIHKIHVLLIKTHITISKNFDHSNSTIVRHKNKLQEAF